MQSLRQNETGLRSTPLLFLYALSGFCTLMLETVWMREVSLRAGNTVVAATLVIVTFFAAAAMGNLLGARLVRHSGRPLMLYGRFEFASGAVAALTFAAGQWAWHHMTAWPAALTGQIPAVLLLVGPPSFLSGVAFPSLTETFVPGPQQRTSVGGLFYGANLLGAAMGVVAGGVVLPYWIGVRAAFALAAVMQMGGGLIAWQISSRIAHAGAAARSQQPIATTGPRCLRPMLARGLLAMSGLLSLAAQALLMMWARQVLQGSAYAITAVLSCFIGGLGLGTLLASKLRRQRRSPEELLATFATLSALLLFAAPAAGEWLADRNVEFHSNSPLGMLVATLGWSALWMLPLTTCLGGVFPVAWELARGATAHEGSVMGGAVALNKLGAAAGAVTGLFVLLPLLGLARATCVIGWGYTAIAIAIVAWSGRLTPGRLAPGLVTLVIGLWQTTRPLVTTGLLPNERALASCCGAYGPVAVVENLETGSRQILLNSQQRLSGTRRALSSQRHQSWVPLLLCREPTRVVTIGMASGISAAAALDFPVNELYAVELVPEVVRAAHEQFDEWNHRLFADPRARVLTGDGRVVLARLPGRFDAIICDLFFPNEDGTANLYSREFFQTARDRLNTNGVFCLWLPCYQHDAETAGIVVRTFLDVFPHAIAVRSNFDPLQPVIGLLGSNQPLPVSREFLSAQLATPALRSVAAQSPFFRSPENAWLLLTGDLRAAAPGFDDFPATTDDRPLFAFLGPRCLRPGGQLVGMKFLDWIGKRFTRPLYPSCQLGGTPPEDVLAAVRAANFYFAAAVAQNVIPGDTRSDSVRLGQVRAYLEKARSLSPNAHLPREALGQ